jgi:hypothetical protein
MYVYPYQGSEEFIYNCCQWYSNLLSGEIEKGKVRLKGKGNYTNMSLALKKITVAKKKASLLSLGLIITWIFNQQWLSAYSNIFPEKIDKASV